MPRAALAAPGPKPPFRGDNVAANARTLADVADLSGRFGDAVLPLALDVTDDDVEAAAREVEAKFGHLDVLVNNVGTFVEEDIAAPASVPTQALCDTCDLNVFGFTK